MSHPARLSLRAPPHLPFVQGWPGIPGTADRKGPAAHGVIEVRIGAPSIKAKWVRAEVRKYESPPPGFSGQGETWEHVGEICTLWSPQAGKEWDELRQADFKFVIPLPAHIPPTVEMAKGSGVRYELVAALCYRQKGGVFKKESWPIIKISEPIRITPHDLHSAWPVYNVPEARSVVSSNKEISLTVQRPNNAFGPTDRILLTASVKSTRAKPFKVKGFECALSEVLTITPQLGDAAKSKKGKGPPAPIVKTRQLAHARHPIDENIGKGGEKSTRLDFVVPMEKILVTVRYAKSISIEYELEVKAVFDSGIPELRMKGIRYTVGPFARSHAQQAVKDIGYVEALCPPGPSTMQGAPSVRPFAPRLSTGPTTTTTTISVQPPLPPASPPVATSSQPPFPPTGFYGTPNPRHSTPAISGFTPSHPVQGFIPRDLRRKSSGTSTLTTTTTTTFEQANTRPQSMQLISGAGNVGFPSPNPATPLIRSRSGRTIDSGPGSPPSPVGTNARYTRSDIGHGDGPSGPNRFSTGTNATFGAWGIDLRKSIDKQDPPPAVQSSSSTLSPVPQRNTPTNWLSAEQEKSRLYNEARRRAAVAQQQTGASLHDLGLDQPEGAPPEYAPPRPEKPSERYSAASRPSSAYTASPAAGPSGSRLEDPTSRTRTPGQAAEVTPPKSKDLDRVYLSAAEEKEQQRRRFEDAQSRVVSGSSTRAQFGNDEDEPIPYDQIYHVESSSSQTGPSQPPPLAVTAGQGSVPSHGTLSEKEQMRRYYEAQNRVAAATKTPPASSSSIVPFQPPPSTAIGQEGSSGLSEKGQLRRYYEARDRVASYGSPQSPKSPATSIRSTTAGTGAGAGAGAVSVGLGIKGDSIAPRSNSTYTTAEEEKEMMRRRFEEAQAAVERSRPDLSSGVGPPAPSAPSGPSGPQAGHVPPYVAPGPTAPAVTPAFPTAEEEKGLMRRRFEDAQAAVERNNRISTPPPSFPLDPSHPTSTSLSTNDHAPPVSSGPPPPLPSKPPREYIDLLNPAATDGPSFAR